MNGWMAYVTPVTIIGLLVLILGLGFLITGRSGEPLSPPQAVAFGNGAGNGVREMEVPLVLVGSGGIERPRFASLEVPEAMNLRLAAVVEELRRQLVDDGVWPDEVPPPTVFVYDRGARERIAILDFAIDDPPAISVSQERQILRSLERTAEAQDGGPDRLVFLVNGRPTGTFLGHLAVPSRLD